jgi:hypothetical protein
MVPKEKFSRPDGGLMMSSRMVAWPGPESRTDQADGLDVAYRNWLTAEPLPGAAGKRVPVSLPAVNTPPACMPTLRAFELARQSQQGTSSPAALGQQRRPPSHRLQPLPPPGGGGSCSDRLAGPAGNELDAAVP